MTVIETQDTVCREDSSSTNGIGDSTSLLGPIGRGMRLKVSRDEPGTTDIVAIASRKCLVGSAPRCNVRVVEPGVAPVACLIIKGAKNNVVRWLDASQELAGGELFEDEVLCAGDPLQVGPVELELLVDEIMSAEEAPITEGLPVSGEDRLEEYLLRLEGLELQFAELQRASDLAAASSDAIVPPDDLNNEVLATISEISTQLADLQSRSSSDRDLWAGEKAELEASLQSRLRQFNFLQDEVQGLRDELVIVRGELGDLAASEDASQRFVEVSQELAKRTKDFEQQQTIWERDRGEFQRQLQQNTECLAEFETQLAEQSERQACSEAARQAAESRADRLQESVQELSDRLAEQQEKYETVRTAWEAERASLKEELAETKQQLAQSAAEESAGAELRETWDRERTDLENQVAEAILRADEIQEGLNAQRPHSNEQHQSRGEARLDDRATDDRSTDKRSEANEQRLDHETSVAPDNPMERLLAVEAFEDDRAVEPEGPLRDSLGLQPMSRDEAESDDPSHTRADIGYGGEADVASNYYEQSLSGLPSVACLDDATTDDTPFESSLLATTEIESYGHPFGPTQSAFDEGEKVAFENASPEAPVSTMDVLARLGRSGDLSDGEIDANDSRHGPIADSSNPPNEVLSRFAVPETAAPQSEEPQYSLFTESPFSPLTSDGTSDSEDGEESIEDYMARLMNRVRGEDHGDEPIQHAQRTAERAPLTEYTEVAEAAQPDPESEAEKFDPETYEPRSQAPELADRMTAMRSLANDSTRTAIASHAKRNWSSVMQLKLLVSVFAFVSVVASIFFFWGDPLLMMLGSLVGIGVLAYWARNAITYRQLLLDSLMLETEGGDYDEPASDDDAAPLDVANEFEETRSANAVSD